VGFGYRRTDLQANAQAKLDDAVVLLKHGRFSNAYYLAGYAVEIALKACIAKQVSAETIPDREFITNIFNHKLMVLIGLAGLKVPLTERQKADDLFAANWGIVAEWSPEARYDAWDPTSAQTLLNAIADPKAGVFQWIKTHW